MHCIEAAVFGGLFLFKQCGRRLLIRSGPIGREGEWRLFKEGARILPRARRNVG